MELRARPWCDAGAGATGSITNILASTVAERRVDVVRIGIYTLGTFEVLIDGAPLTFSRKVQKKPLELLKALVACGGERIREERLAELLYPDAEADNAAHSMTTALYRLRKLLGPDVIQRQNGTLTLNARVCHVDLWDLDRLLNEVGKACDARRIEPIAILSKRLCALRDRNFLGDERETAWALDARERLRCKQLRALKSAAKCLSECAHVDDAISCLECALEIDSFDESIYRALMRCYRLDGRIAEVVRAYDRCSTTLKAQFGIAPTRETDALLLEALRDRPQAAVSYR